MHLHTYLLVTVHNDYLSNILYHYTLFSHSHWFVSTFIQSIKKLRINLYFSHLYNTPHYTFHVVIGCAEHSRAQVFFLDVMRKFGDGPSILEEWENGTTLPFFEPCPYTWEGESSIPHEAWRFHFFSIFLLKLDYTRTFISTVGIFV
jgi:hypothetical protein